MAFLRRYSSGLALGVAALVAGCDEPDPVDEPDPMAQAAVPVVQLKSARALDSGSGLARLSDLFSVTVPSAVPDAQILPWAVGAVELRLDLVRGDNGCLVVDSDQATYVEVTWADRCQSLALSVLGSIRADAELAEVGCDTGTCPSVKWTVDADDLQVSVLGQPVESRYRGVVLIEAPTNGGPLGWETDRTFELDFGVGTYRATSQARWEVDEDDCVTLNLDAELELVAPGDGVDMELEDAIGTMVVTGEGMRQCPRSCPEAGNVFLSYGKGEFLQWTYGARPDRREVEVFSPRGKAFIAQLPCME